MTSNLSYPLRRADECIEYANAWREHDATPKNSDWPNDGVDTFYLWRRAFVFHAYVSQGQILLCAYRLNAFVASVETVLAQLGDEHYTHPNAFRLWRDNAPDEVEGLE